MTLTCETSKETNVKWFIDDEELKKSTDRIVMKDDGKQHFLVIKKVTMADAKTYTCTVGPETTTAKLTVTGMIIN